MTDLIDLRRLLMSVFKILAIGDSAYKFENDAIEHYCRISFIEAKKEFFVFYD